MGINKSNYAAIRSIYFHWKHCELTAMKSMVNSHASSMTLWKIARLLWKLPLPKCLGLIFCWDSLQLLACCLLFPKQWWREYGLDVGKRVGMGKPAALRHLRTRVGRSLLSAGSAFLKDEHVLVHRFPRQAHSCRHDPWTGCSGIWTCYWKGVKSRTHTLISAGGEP